MLLSLSPDPASDPQKSWPITLCKIQYINNIRITQNVLKTETVLLLIFLTVRVTNYSGQHAVYVSDNRFQTLET